MRAVTITFNISMATMLAVDDQMLEQRLVPAERNEVFRRFMRDGRTLTLLLEISEGGTSIGHVISSGP